MSGGTFDGGVTASRVLAKSPIVATSAQSVAQWPQPAQPMQGGRRLGASGSLSGHSMDLAAIEAFADTPCFFAARVVADVTAVDGATVRRRQAVRLDCVLSSSCRKHGAVPIANSI